MDFAHNLLQHGYVNAYFFKSGHPKSLCFNCPLICVYKTLF